MKVCFILPTIGEKIDDLNRSIDSIQSNINNCYLILVDQSTVPIQNIRINTNNFNVEYFHTPVRGLSNARNIGLARVNAEVVAFPDDDSYYEKCTIDKIIRQFECDSSIDVLIGRQVDPFNSSSPVNQNKTSFIVKENDLAYVGNSICIFVRLNEKTKNVYFDLEMGAGRYFGSHEERDYLAKILNNGAKIKYDGSIIVYHKIYKYNEWPAGKTLSYARGMGAYFKRHHRNKIYAFYWLLVRPLGGAIVSFFTMDFHKIRYRVLRLVGNIQGYIKFK